MTLGIGHAVPRTHYQAVLILISNPAKAVEATVLHDFFLGEGYEHDIDLDH